MHERALNGEGLYERDYMRRHSHERALNERDCMRGITSEGTCMRGHLHEGDYMCKAGRYRPEIKNPYICNKDTVIGIFQGCV